MLQISFEHKSTNSFSSATMPRSGPVTGLTAKPAKLAMIVGLVSIVTFLDTITQPMHPVVPLPVALNFDP